MGRGGQWNPRLRTAGAPSTDRNTPGLCSTAGVDFSPSGGAVPSGFHLCPMGGKVQSALAALQRPLVRAVNSQLRFSSETQTRQQTWVLFLFLQPLQEKLNVGRFALNKLPLAEELECMPILFGKTLRS